MLWSRHDGRTVERGSGVFNTAVMNFVRSFWMMGISVDLGDDDREPLSQKAYFLCVLAC